MSIIADVYHGVPRYVGELFRATKAPTLIFLFCFLGVPFLLSTAVAIWTYAIHSVLPMKIMIVGLLRSSIAMDPANASRIMPEIISLSSGMTPRQVALGDYMIYALWVDVVAIFASIVWWEYLRRKFSRKRREERLNKRG